MGIFGSKKKSNEQLRTLSEKEIQDRLYGSFRMNQDADRHEAERLQTYQEAKTSTPTVALELPSTPKVSPSVEATHRPPVVIDRRKETERLAYVSEWTDEEADTTAKAAKFGWLKQGKKVLPASATRPAQPQKAVFIPLLKLFFGEIAQLLRSLTAPSRQVRRRAFWMTLSIVVLSVFLAIHFLNLNREQAMKSPRRSKAATPAAQTVPGIAASMIHKAEDNATPLSRVSTDEDLPASPQGFGVKEPEGRFVIQVCTYANESDAKQLMTRIQREKYPTFIKGMSRSGGKGYYLVFIGRYRDVNEAKRTLTDFQKRDIARPFKDAFVRTL